MSDKKLRVLIISHDASNTGAPILLVKLVKLLQANTNIVFEIIVAKDGPLAKVFSELGNTIVLKTVNYSKCNNLFIYIYSRLKNKFLLLKTFLKARKSDLIFSNTVINGHLLKLLKLSKKPIATYVHELKSVFEVYEKTGQIQNSLKYSDIFLYPCEAVKSNLLTYEVAVSSLKPLDYYVPVSSHSGGVAASRLASNGLLNILGIGTASLRKGTDIFCETARLLNKSEQLANFYWVGGVDPTFKDKLEEYSNTVGFQLINGLPPEEMTVIYNEMDLLFLSSREDPYPLVVLEAAAHARPSIAYVKSGGAPQFIGDDAGWLTEHFDPKTFAEVISGIIKSPELLREKGAVAMSKHENKHDNKSHIISQFLNIVKTFNV